jgi:hypothetical protein
MPFRPVVEVLARQARELPIGLAVHRVSSRRFRNTNGCAYGFRTGPS